MAVTFFAVTLDCPEPDRLARFYQRFLGGRRAVSDEGDFAVLAPYGSGVRIDFQQSANPQPPRWPDGEAPRRHHLEFAVDEDLDEVEQRLRSLGADVPAHQPDGELFRVFVDPAGHTFCVAPREHTLLRGELHDSAD
ncbi:VOC family protein [Streptomyces xiaopingdaonensis]|uniref:VOC family protein n=1 Tax=Streptomyces xiaopingdaonensis TaxID=1565415 RepID=UPI0003001F71|nr:VOC family protein [Streptomyces xiaopingdaonensis]